MFAGAGSLFLLFSIQTTSARNLTYDDTAAITLHFANRFVMNCISLTYPKSPALEQIVHKTTLLHKIAKVTEAWHPLVSWTTLDQIVDARVHKKRKSRDECSRPIYVIFEYKSLKTDLEAVSKLMPFTRAIFLLIMNSKTDSDFFANMQIKVNAEFYTLCPDEKSDRVVFSEVYSVGYAQMMEKVDVGWWTKKDGLVLTAPKYFIRRRNLRRQVLTTASLENWPITSFDQNQFSRGRVIDGFFARLWFDLEVLMNFTTIFSKHAEESTGLEVSDGVFNGLIGMAQRHEIDVVLSEFTMTPRRWNVLDLIQPLMKTRYQIYFRLNDEVVIEWFSIFRPFRTNVWVALMTTIIVCSITLYWINRKANEMNIGEYFRLKLSDSFFLILQTFCSQGTAIVPQRNAVRICLLFSYITAAVILPSYSAALISALSKKTETKPMDSIGEFLKARIPLLVWPDSADYEVFSQADTPLFQEVFKMVNSRPDLKRLQSYEEMLGYICNSTANVAVFGVEPGIQVLLRKFVRNGVRCRVADFTHGVFSSYQTIAFVKNSPYSNIMNINLLCFLERGLVKRYQKQYIPTWVKKDVDPTFEVTIAEVASIFTLLSSGIVLSSFILLFEYYYYHSRQPSDIIVTFDYRN